MIHINLTLDETKIEVEQIAECLRIEFNYPLETKRDFQKLVTLAIQSIRRNLIRAQNNKLKQQQPSVSTTTTTKKQDISNNKSTNIISLIIKDIIDDVIPLKEQATNNNKLSNNGMPDLNMFISNDPLPSVNNSIKPNNKLTIPFFLKEKIIYNIQKSRTCYQVSRYADSSNILIEYQNLIKLGDIARDLTNRYIFERFYSNTNTNVINFVLEQITTQNFIQQLSIQIFQSSTTIKLSDKLHERQHNILIPLLNITLGALIKDFGFDPILYDMSEILYHLIMIRYPNLIQNTDRKITPVKNSKQSSITLPTITSNDESTTEKNILISSLSINPQIANKEVYKQVQISYQTKKQDFNFPLLSNAAPTTKEIINNCKQLFQIKPNFMVNIYYEGEIIKNDLQLSHLFNDLNIKTLCLELK